jgi:hypothetical protein
MKLNKGGIQIKTSAEQEAIYRGKRSTLLRGIHINLTYTVGKALSIFLESIHFGFFGNSFGLPCRVPAGTDYINSISISGNPSIASPNITP